LYPVVFGLQAPDPLVLHFTQLRESGMSKEDAWKVMAVEILAGAGIVALERLKAIQVPGQAEPSRFAIDEAKLVRVIRVEPADDDRIKRLVALGATKASLSKGIPQT